MLAKGGYSAMTDKQLAAFATPIWVDAVAATPLDEVAIMVAEDPSVLTALIGALRDARAMSERQNLHITHLVMAHRGHDWHDEVIKTRAATAASAHQLELQLTSPAGEVAQLRHEVGRQTFLAAQLATRAITMLPVYTAALAWYDCKDAEEIQYLNDLANAIEDARAKEALSDG